MMTHEERPMQLHPELSTNSLDPKALAATAYRQALAAEEEAAQEAVRAPVKRPERPATISRRYRRWEKITQYEMENWEDFGM